MSIDFSLPLQTFLYLVISSVCPIVHLAVVGQSLLILQIHCTLSYAWLLVLVYCPVIWSVCLFGVWVCLFALLSLCSWIGCGPSSGLLSHRCTSLLPLVWICEGKLCFYNDPITPLLVLGLTHVSAYTGYLQVVLRGLNLRSYYIYWERTWCRDLYIQALLLKVILYVKMCSD